MWCFRSTVPRMLLAQTSLTSEATGPGVVLASLSLVLLTMGLACWWGLRIERGLIEEELGLTLKRSSGRFARLRFEEREQRPGARAEGAEVS